MRTPPRRVKSDRNEPSPSSEKGWSSGTAIPSTSSVATTAMIASLYAASRSVVILETGMTSLNLPAGHRGNRPPESTKAASTPKQVLRRRITTR